MGRILASDIKVAQNCLSQDEIKKLERTVSGFFDYIDDKFNKNQVIESDFEKELQKYIKSKS